ncbi:flagellar assembly protein FliH [Halobacillus rhizosphaerae]|uniref:flagellar assembly protein FliH n=1 Tax=Halobacillus rhizosphaerae TaxID=3064889 RepID=UPI00398AA8A6
MSNLSSNTYIPSKVIKIKPVALKESSHKRDDHSEEWLREQAQLTYQQAEAELEKAKSEAEKVLTESRNQLQQEKKMWLEEKEIRLAEAKEEGYKDGFEAGKTEGYQQYKDLIQQANALIKKADENYHEVLDSSEEEIIEIAVKSSEKILHKTIESDPQIFANIVKEVIKEVHDQPEISVFVNPEQYPFIQSLTSELNAVIDSRSRLTVYMRESLSLYDCTIESPFGRIEAGIDSQLNEIRERLTDLAQEERSDE